LTEVKNNKELGFWGYLLFAGVMAFLVLEIAGVAFVLGVNTKQFEDNCIASRGVYEYDRLNTNNICYYN